MGFCNNCNQTLYSNSPCPKCKMSNLLNDQKKSNQTATDKWQDTYSKKIFSSNSDPRQRPNIPHFSTSTTTSTESSQEDTSFKCCSQCAKKSSWSDLSIYKKAYHCKPCLEKKLSCPQCQKVVGRNESRIEFDNKVYHSPCFKCNQCSSPLREISAVQDNEGKACCKSCQLLNSQTAQKQPSPRSPSMSTPLTSSRSSTTSSANSSYFQYRSSRRASVLNDGVNAGSERALTLSGRASPATSATEPSPTLVSNSKGPETSPTIDKPFSSPITARSSLTESKHTLDSSQSRKKKIVKRPCKECGLHVHKKDYRGLRFPSGELVCFHSQCLSCARCHQGFESLDFCTDGKKFYHTECGSETTGSASSEEEEVYPQTPPHAAHDSEIDIVSRNSMGASSPLDKLSEKEDNVASSNTSDLTCTACTEAVVDEYLELGNYVYHNKCLLCTECEKSINPDENISKVKEKLFCEECATNLTKSARPRNKWTAEAIPKPASKSPSEIFKSRKKGLPSLGGVHTCSGCELPMSFSDFQPGPHATRWHKKCLRCTGCSKQMDSAANMFRKDTNPKLFTVRCRECSDAKNAVNRFVR